MSSLEETLSQVLADPNTMEQLMSIAKSISVSNGLPSPESGGIDTGMVQQLAGLAGSTGVDAQQRALLQALSPYVSRERCAKLEKAMRAAKMATVASGFLRR